MCIARGQAHLVLCKSEGRDQEMTFNLLVISFDLFSFADVPFQIFIDSRYLFALFVDSGFKFSAEYQQDKSAATDAE